MEISDTPSIPPTVTGYTGAVASVYSLFGFPLSTLVSIATLIFVVLQIFAYTPRLWNTVQAWYRKLVLHDSKLFDVLSEKTNTED